MRHLTIAMLVVIALALTLAACATPTAAPPLASPTVVVAATAARPAPTVALPAATATAAPPTPAPIDTATPQPAPTAAPTAAPPPAAVSATPPTGCHASGGLPDRACTPGAVDVTKTAIILCAAGYTTRDVRPPVTYTDSLKRTQMQQYSLPGLAADYEEDHLIPLEIGGDPRAEANLWPQPWNGDWNAHKKDELENALKRLVCGGRLPLADAQAASAGNWVEAYQAYVGGGAAITPSTPVATMAPVRAEATPTTVTAPAPGASGAYYKNCAAAKAAGAAPLYRGQPGYRPALDRDGDGVACEK